VRPHQCRSTAGGRINSIDLLAVLLFMQPRIQLAFWLYGHVAGACLASCLPPGLFWKGYAQSFHSPACIGNEDCLDLAYGFAELHEILGSLLKTV